MLRFLILVAVASSAAAAAPVKDETERSAGPRDKVICKRFVETGSLVKATRVCKTKEEWARDRDSARSRINQGGSCVPGANC